MSALVIILLGTVLIQSSPLALDGSRSLIKARLSFTDEIRHALFTLITITLSAVLGFVVVHDVLMPLRLEYLRTPIIVLGIAAIIYAYNKWLHAGEVLQYSPLIILTNHCALLGIALFTAWYSESLLAALSYGFGAACALALLSAAFKALMERIDTTVIPFVFRGIPLSLISAGLMALAWMGFAGLVHN